jgi:two-component system response regulator YesN
MIKAVLFDDEYIVLEALSVLVDWEGLGIELAGTAGDGISALAMFRSIRPEIVLTDIRMPGLDGLQLIEEIMKEDLDTSCIVFSGFNEYEYVKRAIELGVADYVEKPITEDNIERALRKVLGQIDRQTKTLVLEQKWEDSRRELLEKATGDLLQYGYQVATKWEESAGPEAKWVTGVTVLAAKEDVVLPERVDGLAVRLRVGPEFLHVFFDYGTPFREFWDEVTASSNIAESAIGIGRTYESPAGAPESYREAQRALKTLLYLQVKGAIRFEELGGLVTVPEGLTEREEAIILSLRAGSKSGLLDQVDQFVQWTQSEKLDPEIVEREMLKLIYLSLDVAGETAPVEGKPALLQGYMPHIEIRRMAAQGMLAKWFREQMERFADWSIGARENTKHASIERALQYIEKNVSRDVSLLEVASHVGMNANYLSVLFKEVVGETYIKYLTRYRVEMAKVMLRKGMKVQEVSEKVGYLTHRHFSEVFKKYTGVTAGQYKELESNKNGPPSNE